MWCHVYGMLNGMSSAVVEIHKSVLVTSTSIHSCESITVSCCFRLENISEFLTVTLTYDSLGLSRIEGIETFNARFGLLVTTLKKKPYDPLEYRKQDFDIDYQEFKMQLAELEVMNRFENLSLMCSHCAVFYIVYVMLFIDPASSFHGPVL